jgi:IS605 OrfB family transposase
MILTFQYRLKEPSAAMAELDRMAREVNRVWNFCGDTQEHARLWGKRWPSAFDLINLTSGISREIGLHSDTVQAICKQFAVSRDEAGRRPKWRASKGPRRALGWIPFQCARPIKIDGDAVTFLGRRYRFWNSRPVEGEISSGNFSQDARGRWYINLQCEVVEKQDCGPGEVGIDPGLKTLAALSSGEKIENPRILAKHAQKLAIAQRAGRKDRVQAINAKIKNTRKHFHHVESSRLVGENKLIVVGNVSASGLAQTKMAKSVLDAGWSQFRSQLRYKALKHGAQYVEVSEHGSTQACSGCGAVSGPKGIACLGVRDWQCCECGVQHDRDVNSAINILVSGRNAILR